MRRTITKGTCSVLLCVTMLLSSFWGSFSSANATALYSSVFTDELTKYLTSLEAVSEEDYFDTDAYLKQIEEIAKQQSLEVSSGGSSSGETQEEQEVDYWLVEGKFSGITGKVESGFPYTDRMWLVDSKSLSVDLARMSVILACAAYDADNTWHLLDSMKFDVGEDYDPTLEIFNNYGKKLSINDNDHVAFTIAHKIVVDSETGEEYLVYCVPIRGTSKNAEWYSDFNLGTGAFHLGFSKAGNEVLGELGELVQNEVEKGVVRQDGQSFDSNHRIILFTGHSRGAAVSNYVSGLLTVASENQGSVEASIVNRYHLNSKFESNHIFAYTFACPSVTTNTIAETLENVYNFNNAGDCVTLLPLTGGDWGYLRYGKDIVLYDDEPYFDNFQRQFKREVGKDWKSLTDSYHYLGPLYSAFPTPNDFRKGTPQLVFTILAYALGGSNDTTLEELRDYILSDLEMAIAAGKVVYKVLYRVISTLCGHPFTLSDLVNVIVGYANSIYDEKRPAIIDELLVVTESLTSEEIILLKREREYEYKFALIESTINSEINSRDDLIEAKEVVSEWRVFGNDFYSLLYMVFEMYFKSSGETTFDLWYFLSNMKMTLYTPIEHGHAQETYVCWINSKFLGYKGWNGSSVGTLTIPNDIVYIPTNCFYNCRAEIITNHDVYFVGKKFSIIRNLSFSSVNDASYIIHSDMEIKFSMGMVSNGTKVVVDGSIVVQGNADQITPQLINYGNLHITGDYTSENWLTELHNNGDLTIEGNLACNIPKDNVVTLGKLFQEQEDAILTIGGNVSLGLGNGQVTITSGKVVLNGTKQQSILGLIAKDFEVINPEGIKYLSDIKLYGEYKLNNNPLENNGFRTLLYNGSTFADDSDYGELSVSGYYYLDSNVKGNFLITSGSRLIIAEGQDITIDGKVVNRGNSNSSYPPQLINNGKLHITGDYTSENWLTELHNNGELIIDGDLICSIPNDNVVRLGKLFQEQKGATLSVGGNVSLSAGSGYVTITNGKVILSGKQRQEILYLSRVPYLVLENQSPEGVVFKNAINVTTLFNHNQNAFTLYNNGSGSVFVDYDGDGLKDNVDPYPMVGNPCVILVQSIDPEQGTVSVERLETIGGTTHTVVATPTFKYNFLRWEDSTGKNVGTATELTFVARGDQTYTAHFVKRTQPISVSCENGTITAPAKATIESEVTVSVTENTGFILDESSLKCNGVPFTNFTFVMPDEPAVITAVCNRNTYYFNLLDKIGEARAIDFRDYSTESYSNLVNVIQTAGNSLYNHITKAESDAYIQSINEAIAALKARYVIDIDAIGKTEYFCGQSINPEDFTVLAIYDNGTVEERHDYTTNEIDFDNDLKRVSNRCI